MYNKTKSYSRTSSDYLASKCLAYSCAHARYTSMKIILVSLPPTMVWWIRPTFIDSFFASVSCFFFITEHKCRLDCYHLVWHHNHVWRYQTFDAVHLVCLWINPMWLDMIVVVEDVCAKSFYTCWITLNQHLRNSVYVIE